LLRRGKKCRLLEDTLLTSPPRLDELDISSDLETEESTTVKEEMQSAIDMLADVQAALVSVQSLLPV
jgi:hypothetical protein